MKIFSFSRIVIVMISTCTFILGSCKKFLQIEAPNNQIIRQKVFEDDATASAAIAAIYEKMSRYGSLAGGGSGSIGVLRGLSSDELFSNSVDDEGLGSNNILTTNSSVQRIWADAYYFIYSANAVIAGLQNSDKITLNLKNQLLGETFFIRSFWHFYLVNLFGEVPYISSVNYEENTKVSRVSSEKTYQGIIDDLNNAKNLLSNEYVSDKKARPNRWTAIALLSRVYLYSGDWQNANTSSSLILNEGGYNLANIDEVFLNTSPETIWQFEPLKEGISNNSLNGQSFVWLDEIDQGDVYLNKQLIYDFETADLRKSGWIGYVIIQSDTTFFSYKYKQKRSTSPAIEYSIIFRLAEQYLIRAEANAQMNELTNAIDDINSIRSRAGLSDLPESLSQQDVLSAIEKERKFELYAEWAHRWFDLKRTYRIDEVLKNIKPGWTLDDTILPIPESEILINRNLIQNHGY